MSEHPRYQHFTNHEFRQLAFLGDRMYRWRSVASNVREFHGDSPQFVVVSKRSRRAGGLPPDYGRSHSGPSSPLGKELTPCRELTTCDIMRENRKERIDVFCYCYFE